MFSYPTTKPCLEDIWGGEPGHRSVLPLSVTVYTSDCRWVLELDGGTEGFCPSFAAGSALTWFWSHEAGGYCHVVKDMVRYFQAADTRFLSRALHLAFIFCCSFQNRLTWMPAECGVRQGSCAKSRFISEDLHSCVQYLLFCQDLKDKTSLPISVLLNSGGSVWSCWCK